MLGRSGSGLSFQFAEPTLCDVQPLRERPARMADPEQVGLRSDAEKPGSSAREKSAPAP